MEFYGIKLGLYSHGSPRSPIAPALLRVLRIAIKLSQYVHINT